MLLSFIAPYGTNGTSMGMSTGGNAPMNSFYGNIASHTSSNTMGSMSSPMIQSGSDTANYSNIMLSLNQMQIQINQMQQVMANSGIP